MEWKQSKFAGAIVKVANRDIKDRCVTALTLMTINVA